MKKLLTSLLCIAMITVYMPAAVWADDGKTAENLPAAVDGVVTLDKNYKVSNLEPDLTYDLNGHTLTYSGEESIEIEKGQILTFKDSTASPDQIGNGKIVFTQKESLVKGDIHPTTGGTVNAFNIQIESPNSVFFPAGDAAAVNVDSCKVSAGCYCVGTNAGKTENAGVKITLTNSTFVAQNAASDNCPVMINVEGSLKVDNCTITGDRQGVLVRAGEAEINNSTVINTGKYSNDNKYDDDDWGSGNEVPVAAIVVGSHNGKYLDDAIVTVIDTVIESQKDGIPAIYVDANAKYSSDLVLTGIKTQVDGEIVKKDQQKADITITGGTFSDTSAKAYVPDGTELKENKETGKYELAPASNAVAQVGNAGYTDLQEAIDQAGENDTVILLQNYRAGAAITVDESKSIVLELNGKKLTLGGQGNYRDDEITSAEYIYGMINKGTLTIQNGEIIVDEKKNGIVNTGALTIASDARISDNASSYARYKLVVNFGGNVVTSGELTSSANDGLMTFGGTVNITGGKISAMYWKDGSNAGSSLTIFNRRYNNKSKGANVVISGGTLESAAFAASTNNLYSGGAEASNLTITGGTLFSKHTTAVYWPSAGVLTIGDEKSGNGPSITSANGSAIEICSGTLNVYGGALNGGTEMSDTDSIETTQAWVDDFREYSGSSGIGDAITVIARRGGGYVTAPVNVNIVGGQFNSSQNYGIRYMDCNLATEAKPLEQEVSVKITGGDFSGKLAPVDAKFMQTGEQNFISGGTFSGDLPEKYLSEGMDTYGRANGKFTVAEKTPQGQIPDIDPTPGYEWVQDENGNYVEQKIPTPPATVQKPEIIVDDGAKAELSSLGTTATITVEEGYELVDVTLNGVSLGKVTTVTGLKTGDKLVITTQKKLTDEEKDLIEAVESAAIDASTVLGDGYIRVNWTTAGTTEMDYYEIYRSTERDGDYGDTPYFTTKHGRLSGWYKNTKELEKGTCYYYKVRGVKEINGEKYSTPWSDIGYRTYKEIGKGVRNTTIRAWSSAGKGYIRVQWRKSAGYRVDYYEVYRTAKRGSWEDAAYFKTKEGGMSGWYKNTKELKKGTRYYYKVRGVRELDGKKVYTRWSTLAYRIAQ